MTSTPPSNSGTRNDTLFARAQQSTPGGVNSPVRAFRSVGGTPRFITRAEGPSIWDADGKRYIDYIGSWGPAILGHAHPHVIKAVQDAAARGLSFGAPTEGEIEIAENICRLLPSIEQVRLVSSGTEATMSALRLARGATGRDKIDQVRRLLPRPRRLAAGQGRQRPADLRQPDLGRRAGGLRQAHPGARLQQSAAAGRCVRQRWASSIAGVIVEPVAGNMNLLARHAGIPAPHARAVQPSTARC